VLAKPRKVKAGDERAYLVQALRNTFLTGRRTASRRPRADTPLDDVTAADPRSSARPEQAAETHAVFDAIATLAEDFRLALVAVDIAGLSYREAEDVLGTREATIATRLFRAREQVAEMLREVSAPPRSRG
jgi:RNA polymerase sigma-70 factor (ECF subfamily)